MISSQLYIVIEIQIANKKNRHRIQNTWLMDMGITMFVLKYLLLIFETYNSHCSDIFTLKKKQKT